MASKRSAEGRGGYRVRIGAALAVVVAAVGVLLAVWRPRSEEPLVAPGVSKVVWIWEENTNPDDILGDCPSCKAVPYLNELASTYGVASNVRGASFPSLPNYIAGTSGDYWGVADDALPQKHPITQPSMFSQLPPGQAMVFAESMTSNCQLDDGLHTDINGAGYYVTRRTAWPYYVNERALCGQYQVPMLPHLPNAIAAGLPRFTEIVPATCNNFHLGHPSGTCKFGPGETYPSRADSWLRRWVPQLMAGPDWQAGRLAIFIVWDEGSGSAPVYGADCTQSTLRGCRIPLLILSPHTRGVVDPTPHTTYSILRTTQELLGLPLLARAATATSFGATFGLTGTGPPVTTTWATSRMVPVVPHRLLDTRPGAATFDGAFLGGGSVAPGGSTTVQVGGRGLVPAGATGAVLNVTMIDAIGRGFVQVMPEGAGPPGGSSNLNVERQGQIIPNLVIVPLSSSGRVSIYTQGGGHLAVDALGYFEARSSSRGGRVLMVAPSRLLDTRSGLGVELAAPAGPVTGPDAFKLRPAEARSLTVLGRGGVPATDVRAVVLNVVSTEAPSSGFVQVMPAGSGAPGGSSNLNVTAGQTIANLVVVPVGLGGKVTLYAQAGGHLVVDVFAYVTDDTAPPSVSGLFVPLSPGRLLDSRAGPRPEAGSHTSLRPLGRQGIPATGVRGVVLNLTATQTGSRGWVQVIPAGLSSPGSFSNLNVDEVDQTIPNAVISPLGPSGELQLYTSMTSHLVADTSGYFLA